MIKTRITKDISGKTDLCETFSTTRKNLMQTETGNVFGSSVVDRIFGYDSDGNPYSAYHYEETDDGDQTVSEADLIEALAELGVKDDETE